MPEWITAIAAAIAALATVAYLYFTIRIFGEARRAADAAEKSIVAAQKSADAAQKLPQLDERRLVFPVIDLQAVQN